MNAAEDREFEMINHNIMHKKSIECDVNKDRLQKCIANGVEEKNGNYVGQLNECMEDDTHHVQAAVASYRFRFHTFITL